MDISNDAVVAEVPALKISEKRKFSFAVHRSKAKAGSPFVLMYTTVGAGASFFSLDLS
jgi:hypothetical protein